MSNFDEKTVERIKKLEREVERLRVKESPGAWQDWTPTLNTGGADLSGYNSARYCQIGKLVFFTFQASVRDVTGNGLIEIGLPVTCATHGTNASAVAYPINGTYEKVQCKLTGNVMTVAKSMFSGAWAGTETGVYVIVEGFYEAP